MTGDTSKRREDDQRAQVRPEKEPGDQLPGSESDHLTRLVAPLIVAFTLPTIAMIVTVKDLPTGADEAWRDAVLALLVATSGFLLGGTQLSVGGLTKTDWSGTMRAVLTYSGLVTLTGAILLIVLPALRSSPAWLTAVWVAALLVLVLGVGVPIALRIRLWAARSKRRS